MRAEVRGFIDWLNINSPAIQAFSAVAIVGLTLLLAWLTWRSVRVAKAAARAAELATATAQQQLRASLQPVLELQLSTDANFESNAPVHRFSKGGQLTITNGGDVPVKLKKVSAVVQSLKLVGADAVIDHQYESELHQYTNRVLIPRTGFTDSVVFELQQKEPKHPIYGLRVICSDLSDVSRHSFFWHPREGIRHTMEQ